MWLLVVLIFIFISLEPCFSYSSDFYSKATNFYYNKNFDMAKIVLEKLIKETTNEEILLMLGNSYMVTGEFDKAITTFKEGILLEQMDWVFTFNTAYAYYLKKEYTNSLSYFRQTISKNPSFPKSYWFGGMASINILDVDTTISMWEKYLEIAPNGEESENIRKALELLKAYGTNAIPEIVRKITGEEDLDKLIEGLGNGVDLKTEQRTIEDTSLEEIEK